MELIVVGGGIVGRRLLSIAQHNGDEVTVIERDEDRANDVAVTFDCLVVNADATSEATLREADPDEADAVVSTTGDDAANLMILMLAKRAGVDSLVSTVNDPDHLELFRSLGANAIGNPEQMVADYLYRAMRRPSIRDVLPLGDGVEVFEVSVAEEAAVAGRSLAEADANGLLRGETRVLSIERREEVVVPDGDTRFQPGDLVTVFTKTEAETDVSGPFIRPDEESR